VRLCTLLVRHVLESNLSNWERVGHKRAVTLPGDSFRAHQYSGPLACRRDGAFESRREVRREIPHGRGDFENRNEPKVNVFETGFETGKATLDEYLERTFFYRGRCATPESSKHSNSTNRNRSLVHSTFSRPSRARDVPCWRLPTLSLSSSTNIAFRHSICGVPSRCSLVRVISECENRMRGSPASRPRSRSVSRRSAHS
jgi:hypothetical protein